MRLGPYEWDWRTWGLSKQDPLNPRVRRGLFSLRCFTCRSWTIGCEDPDCGWFCGLCPSCDADLQEAMLTAEETD